jgi:thiamine kinase-like enzyme
VLNLLRDELQLPGWSNLPCDLPASLLHIHKVSGALTNAVFFASIPECILDVATTIPVVSAGIIERATPLSLNDESTSTLTPTGTPRDVEVQLKTETRTIKIAAPTLLLRVYGPSSGSLISRKTELHILHTLSSDYAIGPRVLGTFSNGRVEQYFHSRALVKEELRDARISRWIGRRMRELHRVDLARMIVSDPRNVDPAASKSRSRGGSRERSGIDISSSSRNGSGIGTSIYSTSSGSSIFSFGTSIYSTSSAGSTSSLTTIHDDDANFGTPVTSPRLLPQRGSSESMAALKKRSRSSGVHSSRKLKDSPGVWDMITRWTREAKRVLKELDDLAALPGFSQLLTRPRSHSVPSPTTASSAGSATPPHSTKAPYVHPLSSPSLTFALRASLNLPLFEQQIKLYRNHVGAWERRYGPSLRVFSHNDTQYGNLLIMAPKEEGTTNGNGGSGINGAQRMLPHQQIIVVDFEYASANPRGFDIGASISPALS